MLVLAPSQTSTLMNLRAKSKNLKTMDIFVYACQQILCNGAAVEPIDFGMVPELSHGENRTQQNSNLFILAARVNNL
jgi:hypothetical protein